MSWIEIEIDDGRTAFRPGDVVEGDALWTIEGADGAVPHVESAEVRLVWFTRGRGDRDSDIVAHKALPEPRATDRRRFRLTLPAGPYSVSGKLVSIVWAVEVVLEPGRRAGRTEIVVSPTGRPIPLHPDLEPEPATGWDGPSARDGGDDPGRGFYIDLGSEADGEPGP